MPIRPRSGKRANINARKPHVIRRAKKPLQQYEDGSEDELQRQSQRFDQEALADYSYQLGEDFEDEELSEDAAFNDEDDDRYGEVVEAILRRNSKRKRKQSSYDDDSEINEVEDGENDAGAEDSDIEGGVLLSDLLDQPASNSEPSDDFESASRFLSSLDSGDHDGESDQEGDVVDVDAFIRKSQLSTADEGTLEDGVAEGEHALSDSLSMADLLNPLSTGTTFVRQQLSRLSKDPSTRRLGLPLTAAQQSAEERKSAYQATRSTLSEWQADVDRYRTAATVDFVDRSRTGVSVQPIKAESALELELDSVLKQLEPTASALPESSLSLQGIPFVFA